MFIFHLYADDCQMYVSIPKKSYYMIKTITDCLADIWFWISASFLGFNESKTEVIVFFTDGRKDDSLDHLSPAPLEQL